MAKKRSGKMQKVMHEFKHGTLHSGSKKGPKVKSRKQAIAIGMSEARKAGGNPGHKKKGMPSRGSPPKTMKRVSTEKREPKDRGPPSGMFSRRRSEARERRLEDKAL